MVFVHQFQSNWRSFLNGPANKELIYAKFHRVDADAICKIPVSRRSAPDAIFWLHSKDGVYSCKSGYQVARSLGGLNAPRVQQEVMYGRRFESLECRIKLSCLVGVLVMKFCQPVWTWQKGKSLRIIYVSVVGENLKLKHMYCGNVGLHKMFRQDVYLGSKRCQTATAISLSFLRLC